MSIWLDLCSMTLQSFCLMPIRKVREFTLDDVVISIKGGCRASGAEGCRNGLADSGGPAQGGSGREDEEAGSRRWRQRRMDSVLGMS
ncbi:MAG: hypothetical protein K0M48_14720 [Thiobacillus sp.]|nr:hypothetical protein [Thiobacillus sp.]